MISGRQQSEEIQRLRWQCRRGMLELDVALRRFLDEEYLSLGPNRQAAFVRLLQVQDRTLHEWLMGRSVPEDADMRKIVARMRSPGD